MEWNGKATETATTQKHQKREERKKIRKKYHIEYCSVNVPHCAFVHIVQCTKDP